MQPSVVATATNRATTRADPRWLHWPPRKRPLFAMPLFWKPYRSDVTEFIDTLKKRDPLLEERQRQGRALLWDKSTDRDVAEAARASRVAQQPYVYQTKT